MKIALVSPYDFAFPGGVTNHISSLERYLTLMGHEVKVISPASRAIPDFGDRFIPIGKPRPIPASGSICRVTISPLLSSQIKPVLEAEKFDVIHLHEPLMPMLCTTVLRMSNTANVGTFHAHGSRFLGYNFGRPLTTPLLKRWISKLNGRIAVSKPAMDFVNGHLGGSYTIIPNGVDTTHFSPDVPPVDEFGDGKVNILFVGRLEKRKGLNYLLKAYRQAKREVPESRLIVVGPGTRLRRKYEKYIAHHGIKDVVFAGFTSYAELPRYYQTADIFCAPATSCESFGIVLIEAMALGKPIVASNIKGYASVMSHGAEGLLVPPKDEKNLAQALIPLMGDKSLRQQMGARGLAKVQDYSWQKLSQRVYDYYLEALGQSA